MCMFVGQGSRKDHFPERWNIEHKQENRCACLGRERGPVRLGEKAFARAMGKRDGRNL